MHSGLGPGVAHMEAERPSTSPIGALSLVKKFTKFPGGMPERPPGQPSGAAQALARDAQTGGRTPGLKACARAPAPVRTTARQCPRRAADSAVNPSSGAGRRTPEEQLWVHFSAAPDRPAGVRRASLVRLHGGRGGTRRGRRPGRLRPGLRGGGLAGDGPAVLMDSVEAGPGLGMEYPTGRAGQGPRTAPGRTVASPCGAADGRTPG